jgi:hypothetical protein
MIYRNSYDVKGKSRIKNYSFNGEIIVMDLNEEWVYHIGFSFLSQRNAGNI